MENSFVIKNITKSYGKNRVLNDISFEFPYGNIIGVLGLNGAGKTTLFDIIAGFINYKGEVGKKYPYDVAYMSTNNMLIGHNTIQNMIEFYKDFMPEFDYKAATNDMKKLGLNLKKHSFKLSMGQKRIVSFVLAINCKSEIYLFDEPFTNLDIIYRDFLTKKLIEKIDENKVFLISSHELIELEDILSHITILHNAKLSVLKSVEDIRDGGISISEYYKESVLC